MIENIYKNYVVVKMQRSISIKDFICKTEHE